MNAVVCACPCLCKREEGQIESTIDLIGLGFNDLALGAYGFSFRAALVLLLCVPALSDGLGLSGGLKAFIKRAISKANEGCVLVVQCPLCLCIALACTASPAASKRQASAHRLGNMPILFGH